MLLYYSGLKTSLTVSKNDCFKFKNNTTYGLGGGAACAYFPANLIQARKAYDECVKQNKKIFVLGNGSNVLASDNGFDGGVICTQKLKGIVRLSGNRLLCLAGTKISELLSYCKAKGLGGLEFTYGIPATVGGAAYMNAGVGDYAIGKLIDKVWFYDGKMRYLCQNDCNFAYRHSTMRDINGIILAIIVKTTPTTNEEIESRIEFFKQKRRHLPAGRSCGCVFKNPCGYSAGALIEKAGLKGVSIGCATVSEKHANFIINRGNCAEDVKRLISLVKRTVWDKFGVQLSEEVVYIGDFNGTDS